MKVSFPALKARIPIEAVCADLGISLKPDGFTNDEPPLPKFRGGCPACESTNRKEGDRYLTVTPLKGVFRCHASKAGGSILDLVVHVYGIELREAGEYLAKTFPERKEAPQPRPEVSMKAYRTTPLEAAEAPLQAPKKEGFNREKYRANLDRGHKLLEGLDPEFLNRADIGVPARSTFKGEVVFPTYDRDTMEFMEYVAITWDGKIKRYKRRGSNEE